MRICDNDIYQISLSFNHTSWVAVVTPTDRPKLVCDRCVMEVVDGVFVLSLCFLEFYVGVRAFVIGLSQISSFFSLILILILSRWDRK